MSEKYVLFSLDDEKSKNLGEVISNKTARHIVNYLAEQEASEKDIADDLDIPINTVEYNLKKLLKAGVVEKSKNYFWSKKGKRIDMYNVVNKLIVIAPKNSFYSKLKGIIPAFIVIGLISVFIAIWKNSHSAVQKAEDMLTQEATNGAIRAFEAAGTASSTSLPVWAWFLTGGVIAIVMLLIWNWKKL